jgi:hypothetical protein
LSGKSIEQRTRFDQHIYVVTTVAVCGNAENPQPEYVRVLIEQTLLFKNAHRHHEMRPHGGESHQSASQAFSSLRERG